jgi:hypothetical protein
MRSPANLVAAVPVNGGVQMNAIRRGMSNPTSVGADADNTALVGVALSLKPVWLEV